MPRARQGVRSARVRSLAGPHCTRFDIVEAAEAMRRHDYQLYDATMNLTAMKQLAEENLARNQVDAEWWVPAELGVGCGGIPGDEGC